MKIATVLSFLLASVVAAAEFEIIKIHEVPAEKCKRTSKVSFFVWGELGAGLI
jgi:hypothetical protein